MTEPRLIYLHGQLGEDFGTVFRLAVDTPFEAVRAIAVQRPGFHRAIMDGFFKIMRGDDNLLTEAELSINLGFSTLHIVPVLAGSGLVESLGYIIGGLALAAGAFFFAPAIPVIGAVAASTGVGIGLSIAATGVSALLTAKPNAANGRSGVDERASDIFTSPQNVSVQGGCVPVVIGRFLVGSVVASSGISTDQV